MAKLERGKTFMNNLVTLTSLNSMHMSVKAKTETTCKERDSMRAVFDTFDDDGNGYIDVDELKMVMLYLGHNLTPTETVQLLQQMDINNDGKLDFSEFCNVLQMYREAAQFKLTEGLAPPMDEIVGSHKPTYPRDATPVVFWQIFCAINAMYFWITVLYADTIGDEDAATFMRATLTMEILGSFVILGDMIVSARIGGASEAMVTFSKRYFFRWLWVDVLCLLPLVTFVPTSHMLAKRIVHHARVLLLIKTFGAYFTPSARIQATRTYVLIHFYFLLCVKAILMFAAFVHLATVIHTFVNQDSDSYLQSLFVVTYSVTGVGYGTVPTKTDEERIYSSLLCLATQVISAIIVGRLSQIVLQSDVSVLRNHEILQALEVGKTAKFPAPLQRDFVGYREKIVSANLGESELIANLPHALQKSIILFVRLKMISSVPIFADAHRSAQVVLAQNLEAFIFRPSEVVFWEGELVAELFIISYGYVQLRASGRSIAKTLRQGNHFGVDAILQPDHIAKYTARTINYSELFGLGQEDFAEVCSRFPFFEHNMNQLAKSGLHECDFVEVPVEPSSPTTTSEELALLSRSLSKSAEQSPHVTRMSVMQEEDALLNLCNQELLSIEAIISQLEGTQRLVNVGADAASDVGELDVEEGEVMADGDAPSSGFPSANDMNQLPTAPPKSSSAPGGGDGGGTAQSVSSPQPRAVAPGRSPPSSRLPVDEFFFDASREGEDAGHGL